MSFYDSHDVRRVSRPVDDERYELGCYVVIPNHVHAIIRPTQPGMETLEMILKSCKSHSGRPGGRQPVLKAKDVHSTGLPTRPTEITNECP